MQRSNPIKTDNRMRFIRAGHVVSVDDGFSARKTCHSYDTIELRLMDLTFIHSAFQKDERFASKLANPALPAKKEIFMKQFQESATKVKCNVRKCANHNGDCYCKLNAIRIDCGSSDCTNCMDFQSRD